MGEIVGAGHARESGASPPVRRLYTRACCRQAIAGMARTHNTLKYLPLCYRDNDVAVTMRLPSPVKRSERLASLRSKRLARLMLQILAGFALVALLGGYFGLFLLQHVQQLLFFFQNRKSVV